MEHRIPQVGDYVTIHAALCEWDGVSGQVVQRPNFDTWPFAIGELELHGEDSEDSYTNGWVDPWVSASRLSGAKA